MMLWKHPHPAACPIYLNGKANLIKQPERFYAFILRKVGAAGCRQGLPSAHREGEARVRHGLPYYIYGFCS